MTNARNRMYTRFIPSEEVGAVAAWQFGRFGEPALPELPLADGAQAGDAEPVPPPEPEEARLQRAWDGGHAAGYAEGHADAARVGHEQLDAYVSGQGRENAGQLMALVQSLEQRLAACEQTMARQVLDLAAELARQIVRRELAVRPDAVLPVVREALALLGTDHKPASVRLHPQDLECVGAALREEFPRATISWIADDQIERGGCTVETGGTLVDGTLARRWQRALANLGLDAPWDAAPPETEAAHDD
ncbi:flagellar assembly protein FliH [Pseudorhodoferax sp. Leaf267]|uniref:FliH/SctL family protein n=1 Tax=Pseudorhodoferax sp. Leaf267 TaxID=1736316 RepID=UPI0006F6FC66|nr:flagellar assembly protein FliH [Pseudorhodoferax sp. Leaf267]KQP13784.1 hypothetical protein ASF43_18025 [Pseudorhodoferax sp. Leaf267]